MRKTTRTPPKLSSKRILRLSRESIRMLTHAELSLAAGGCPTGSWPSYSGPGTWTEDTKRRAFDVELAAC